MEEFPSAPHQVTAFMIKDLSYAWKKERQKAKSD
jgi:hypothetical protein